MGFKHVHFFSRTVLVNKDNVEGATRILNRILGREGLFDQFRKCQFHERATQTRRRVNYERCKALYDEDMNRKLQFILRKNRIDPFPGCG